MGIDIFKDLGIGASKGSGLSLSDKNRLVAIANTASSISTPIMTDLANTIGSPATASDIESVVITNIQGPKNTIATNLNSYGISANGTTDSLASLAAKTGSLTKRGADTQATAIVALTNLVTNGSFESGATGYGANGGTLSIDTTTYKFGTQSAKFVTTANGDDFVLVTGGTTTVGSTGTVYPAAAGHIIYICTYAKTDGTQSIALRPIAFNSSGGVIQDAVQTATAPTSWTFKSCNYTMPASSTCLMLRLQCAGTGTAWADGTCLIDLTASYGVGSEPTQAQMDTLMQSLGGYFDGTAVVEKIPNGVYNTNGTTGSPEVVTASNNLIPSNILAGKNVLGVTGTITDLGASQTAVNTWTDGAGRLVFRVPSKGAFTGVMNGTYPDLGFTDTNFIASNIKSGVSIFGLTGSLTSVGSTTYNTAGTYTFIVPTGVYVIFASLTSSTGGGGGGMGGGTWNSMDKVCNYAAGAGNGGAGGTTSFGGFGSIGPSAPGNGATVSSYLNGYYTVATGGTGYAAGSLASSGIGGAGGNPGGGAGGHGKLVGANQAYGGAGGGGYYPPNTSGPYRCSVTPGQQITVTVGAGGAGGAGGPVASNAYDSSGTGGTNGSNGSNGLSGIVLIEW